MNVHTSPDVAETLTGLLKTARGERLSHLQPSVGRPISPLRRPSSLNLYHQGECGRQTGATKNRKQQQLNGDYQLIPKTNVANVVHQEQDHHEEAQHPASMISPATLLPPALILVSTDVDQSPPCLEPSAPAERPAPQALTSPSPVSATPVSLRPSPMTPAQIISSPFLM